MTPTQRTRRARLEDAQWLADAGESLTGAARRLNTTPDALTAFLRRHDPTTLGRLRAHEPHDPNQRPGIPAMSGKGKWGA